MKTKTATQTLPALLVFGAAEDSAAVDRPAGPHPKRKAKAPAPPPVRRGTARKPGTRLGRPKIHTEPRVEMKVYARESLVVRLEEIAYLMFGRQRRRNEMIEDVLEKFVETWEAEQIAGAEGETAN
jgi:hypothetical protein